MNNITYYKAIMEGVRKTALERKRELIQEFLYLYIDNLILREKYLHRNKGKMNISEELICDKCGNNWTHQFVRNGTYKRSLMVKEGYIPEIKVPRIKCTCCGKKIKRMNGIIERHARLWYDTDMLIKELFMLRASIRDIKASLKRRNKENISTGTVVNNIRKMKRKKIEIKDYPREVGLDGFWGKVKSEEKRKENIGLLAIDLNKNSRNRVIGWDLCDSENYKNWNNLIEYLDKKQRINHETGLINYVSDGQKGILASIDGRTDYNTICSFHILGNIKQNMQNEPHSLTFKLMKEAKEIFKQKSFEEAESIYRKIERKWWRRASKAVKNLRRSLYATKDFWNNKDKLTQTNNIAERLIKEYKRKIKQMEGLRSKSTAESVMELLTMKINNKNNWYKELETRVIA